MIIGSISTFMVFLKMFGFSEPMALFGFTGMAGLALVRLGLNLVVFNTKDRVKESVPS